MQERKKMLLDGWADLVGSPTYLRGSWGHASPGNSFYMYALKSIGIMLKMDPYY